MDEIYHYYNCPECGIKQKIYKDYGTEITCSNKDCDNHNWITKRPKIYITLKEAMDCSLKEDYDILYHRKTAKLFSNKDDEKRFKEFFSIPNNKRAYILRIENPETVKTILINRAMSY